LARFRRPVHAQMGRVSASFSPHSPQFFFPSYPSVSRKVLTIASNFLSFIPTQGPSSARKPHKSDAFLCTSTEYPLFVWVRLSGIVFHPGTNRPSSVKSALEKVQICKNASFSGFFFPRTNRDFFLVFAFPSLSLRPTALLSFFCLGTGFCSHL